MSFCPTKDIHSVYLDNEMPEIYKAEYESHLSTCQKCQREVEQLKSLRRLLNADAASVTPDAHYLDDSFARLSVKMNYARNTGKSKSSPAYFLRYVLPAAAAAAVFAVVLPFGLKGSDAPGSAQSVQSVASAIPQVPTASNVSVGGGNGRVISGNINGAVLSPVASGSTGKALSGGHYTRNSANSLLKEVDVFRPEFNEDKTISIKITVPGMDEIPVTTEIELPLNVSSLGQF